MEFNWSFLRKLLSKDDYSDTALIAWPVIYKGVYPPKDPHVTLFNFPNVTRNPEWEGAMVAAIKATPFDIFPVVEVKHVSLFGPDKNIPVLEVENEWLHEYHAQLQVELEARGIVIDNTYPEYKPHITITQEEYENLTYPKVFTLKPVRLWWRKTQRIIT